MPGPIRLPRVDGPLRRCQDGRAQREACQGRLREAGDGGRALSRVVGAGRAGWPPWCTARFRPGQTLKGGLGFLGFWPRQCLPGMETLVSTAASAAWRSRMCLRMKYCSATPAKVEVMMYRFSPLGML